MAYEGFCNKPASILQLFLTYLYLYSNLLGQFIGRILPLILSSSSLSSTPLVVLHGGSVRLHHVRVDVDPGGDVAHEDAVDGQLGAGDDEAARAEAQAEHALARQAAAAHVAAHWRAVP